jgi:hypothetical protein
MRTTFMRGPESQPPPFYERKIARVASFPKAEEAPTFEQVVVELAGSIPNGDADMDVTISGRRHRITLERLVKDQKIGTETFTARPEGDQYPSIHFQAQWDAAKTGFTAKDLVGLTAQIYSRKYPPSVPKPSPELQRLLDNQELIRININNLAPGR